MGRKALTTKEFIEKARVVHGTTYSYEKVQYQTTGRKIIITCPTHGDFSQRPYSHLEGKGCKKCVIDSLTTSTQDFINTALTIHHNKYDYSYVEYKNNHTKIKIVCPSHGPFFQMPSNHILRKQGCPSCSGNRKLTTKEFIQQSKLIHGELYDYSKVKYVNDTTKVEIVCKKHGVFKQRPNDHKNKQAPQGCPKCKMSKGEKKIYNFLQRQGIEFSYQHRFKDCKGPKNKHPLSFDFYLPVYDMLIEFDGVQHFDPIYFTRNNPEQNHKRWERHRLMDDVKNQYASQCGIKMLRIPHWEYEHVEFILQSELY